MELFLDPQILVSEAPELHFAASAAQVYVGLGVREGVYEIAVGRGLLSVHLKTGILLVGRSNFAVQVSFGVAFDRSILSLGVLRPPSEHRRDILGDVGKKSFHGFVLF